MLFLICFYSQIAFSQSNFVDSLFADLKTAKNDTSKANTYNALSLELYSSYPDTVIYFSLASIELCEKNIPIANSIEKIAYLKAKSGALNNLGFTYENKGQLKLALTYYQEGLVIQKEIKDKIGEAQTYNNIGYLYMDLNNSVVALDYFQKSLKLREEINNQIGISESLNNLGLLYRKFGDPNCKSQIKDVCFKAGLAKALDMYLRSMKIYEELNNQRGIATVCNNIGSVHVYLKDDEKAMLFFDRSLKIREEFNDKRGMSIVLNNIGAILLRRKAYSQAEQSCLKSLELAKEIGYPDNIKRSSETLSKIYSDIGDNKKALEMFKLFILMRDSINSSEAKKETEKLYFQIEFDKKFVTDSLRNEEKNKVIALDLEHKKTQSYYLIIGLLLVIVFALFIFKRFQISQKQKEEIGKQKELVDIKNHIIEEKQKEIIDSINYAKRIQYTLLAHSDFLKSNLTEHFIYFNPKDIVSGDFYWATKNGNKFYLAVCDSTGHGVPGAFMSLLNIGFLSEAINEKGIERPNEILNYVRQRLIDNISKDGQKDGFDGILMCIDYSKKLITYAAANNGPLLIRNGEAISLEYDKMPVGIGQRTDLFKEYTIDLEVNDTIYLYTDGFADQFGGPRGKKFMYKKLSDLILNSSNKPMEDQKSVLINAFEEWKGSLEQVDDVCIIGIRF